MNVKPSHASEVIDKAYEAIKDSLSDEQKEVALKLLWKLRAEIADAYVPPDDLAEAIYHRHLNKGTMDLEAATKMGMIAKKDLADGAQYIGTCRNAYVAMWRAKRNRFVHLRTKFGDTFAEEIAHPSDDEGFDVFCPVERIG